MKNYKKKSIRVFSIIIFISLTTTISLCAQTSLQQGFQHVPDSIKPSVYYYWLSDNISQQGVQKDIEAMAKVGIGRAFIGNIGLNKEETSYGKVKLFSDEWWKVTKQAITTATKEGVDIGLFNSPGWSQSGGPWIKESQSMRYLANREIKIKGPVSYDKKLPAAPDYFQDVVLLAFPEPASEETTLKDFFPVVTTSIHVADVKNLFDGDTTTAVTFPGDINAQTVFTIDISTQKNFTARSLTLLPAASPFMAHVALQGYINGGYQTIQEFDVDRSNPEKNVGFIAYPPVAIAFKEITSNKYRLVFSNISGKPSFAEINLSPAVKLERYEEKQLAKMFQTPLPLWNEYQWSDQPKTSDASLIINNSAVINISKFLSADGTLKWQVPKGNWVIVRYGMMPTGVTNSPASPEGTGFEMDKLNSAYIQHHFDSFVGKIQKNIDTKDRASLKWMVADSYETGSQNWTDGMAADFKKQYGYDPFPWLPVLTGKIVESADKSNRFLWDLRRLVADKVAYDYVGGLRKVAHENGLRLWLENYGHWGFPSEFLKYGGQSDEVAGEFWNEGSLGSIECRAASSAAHIYGKTKVAAESFTAAGLAYARYPALLKKRGDWSFTEGINNTLLHVFVEQPYDSFPGVNAGFGTEFNRNNTWFYKGKAFIDYVRRCNYLLQQGKPVNDVAYFIGEDAPKMTGIRNPELPAGYQFDYINAEVIENRLSVKDGKFILPDGMSYRLLVLPPLQTMRPALLNKIQQLVKEGGVILGPAPERSPSMENYPAADKEVQTIAATLWNKKDTTQHINKYGEGTVFNNVSMEEVFNKTNITPDIVFSDSNFLYTHRKTNDADIYFISNQSDSLKNIKATFRVTGMQPELWDAVTGDVRDLNTFTFSENTTTVPLQFDAYESMFIIFKKHVAGAISNNKQNFPAAKTLLELNNPWTVHFDKLMRGPEQPVLFNQLQDWSLNDNDSIKNYSGTAVYNTTFNMQKVNADETIFLDLGNVKDLASVKLNGKELGTVWTAPWQVNITSAIQQGENILQIEVVNTWVNRLIGDSKLPLSERRTWANVNPYTPQSKYEPSGLIGPVKIVSISYK